MSFSGKTGRKRERHVFTGEEGLAKIPFARNATREVHHDSENAVLKVYANKRSLSFVVEKFHNGEFLTKKLGAVGSLSLAQAQELATQWAKQFIDGTLSQLQSDAAMETLTLADGFALAVQNYDRAATRSYYASVWANHLEPKFGKRRMVELSKSIDEVKAWYRTMKEKNKFIADACVKTMNSIYLHSRDHFHHLPRSPGLYAKDKKRGKYVPKRYDISERSLHEHHAAIARATNEPVKQAFLDFVYFTGMRPRTVRELRWSWFMEGDDFQPAGFLVPADFMKVPNEFFCPLTDQLLEVIARVSHLGSEFVFPSPSTGGRIGDYKLPGAWLASRLRKHFATAAHKVLGNWAMGEALMAHTLPALGKSYVHPTHEDLAEAAAKVHSVLAAKGGYHERGTDRMAEGRVLQLTFQVGEGEG
ncbi:hypothetical protein RGQ15_10310 [Paracoccus sp. MBLB3053]|uniref:Integrase n=1 Tax=Paracoccus aurantius TaxID=3073814 RepID=A0ABU2HT97_9RHOB|nr:hypothetical protein [Paracoccus sp. MBLB3053]MDS9467957.1 hypothetical protein [Paracoccus sp. MBLB3053]